MTASVPTYIGTSQKRGHTRENHMSSDSVLHNSGPSTMIWCTARPVHGADKAKKLLIDEPVWEDAILIKSDGFPTYHWANVL